MESARSAVEEYLDWLATTKRRKAHTVYTYQGYLNAWLTWCDQYEIKPSVAGTEEFEKFLKRPRYGRAKGQVGAPHTINKEATILGGFYAYMQRRHGWLDPTVDAGLPSLPPPAPPSAIDLPTWRKIWECDRLPDDARVVLGLGAFCGLRRFEIAALAPRNFKHGWLVDFQRKHHKVGRLEYEELIRWIAADAPDWCSSPNVQFFDPLARILRARRGMPSIFDWSDVIPANNAATRKHSLAPGGIDPQRIYKRLASWLQLAKLPPNTFTPHDLRRTAITLWVNPPIALEIVKACELADHSNPVETMRYTRQARLSEWRAAKNRRDRFGQT